MIRLSQIPTQAQADAVKAAGNGAYGQDPRAGPRKGRARLARQLVELGVPSSATATLGWVTGAELDEPEQEPELSPEEE